MDKISRKGALIDLLALPLSVAAVGAVSSEALAAAMKDDSGGTKAALHYVDKSMHGVAKCSTCTLFIAGKTPTAKGKCSAVKGAISPGGWCQAYNKKA